MNKQSAKAITVRSKIKKSGFWRKCFGEFASLLSNTLENYFGHIDAEVTVERMTSFQNVT